MPPGRLRIIQVVLKRFNGNRLVCGTLFPTVARRNRLHGVLIYYYYYFFFEQYKRRKKFVANNFVERPRLFCAFEPVSRGARSTNAIRNTPGLAERPENFIFIPSLLFVRQPVVFCTRTRWYYDDNNRSGNQNNSDRRRQSIPGKTTETGANCRETKETNQDGPRSDVWMFDGMKEKEKQSFDRSDVDNRKVRNERSESLQLRRSANGGEFWWGGGVEKSSKKRDATRRCRDRHDMRL